MKYITYLGLSILAAVCLSIYTAPVDKKVDNQLGAVEYLEHFGYLEGQTGQNWTTEEVQDAIRLFQSFANITVTGEMDNATMEVMNMPRCGVPDMGDTSNNAKRRKRYRIIGPWRKRNLTYKISTYTGDMSQSTIDQVIARAFYVWAQYSRLEFKRIYSGRADIVILFTRGDHGDGDPFDGPGRTLAHAYFPFSGGDAHFDDDETFTDKSGRGINLFQVAAHEFGHSLGLDHSADQNALMTAFYRGYQPNFRLGDDDIRGIQRMYGIRKKEEPDPTPPPTTDSVVPNQCSGILDAITSTADGTTYAFRDQYYWTEEQGDRYLRNPAKISEGWPGLPDNIDAAVYWSTNRKTYFFKGGQYWRFSNRVKDSGYPKSISIWGGLHSNIDAAFVWSGNGKTYFIKGGQYYRYNTGLGRIDDNYPRHMSVWNGLPYTIDAALQYRNGKTYFFSGDQYYRFNDATISVDIAADPPYPRPIAHWWFEGCTDSANLVQSNQMIAGSHAVLPSLIVIYCSLMLKIFL